MFFTVCFINITRDLTPHHPLILKENSNEFMYPNSESGIQLAAGEKLRLVCTGDNNTIQVPSNPQELTVECVNYNVFQFGTQGLKDNFKNFPCSRFPETIAEKSGKNCSQNFTEINIGYKTSKGFVKVLTTCFNEDKKDSLYSHYNLSSTILQQQTRVPEPSHFYDGGFYQGLPEPPNKLYERTDELEHFAKILNSEDLAKKYIKLNGSEFFLARGHMTARYDFLYGTQQRATFYYVNCAPQWQVSYTGCLG